MTVSHDSIFSFYLLFSMLFLFISRDYDLVSILDLPHNYDSWDKSKLWHT